VVPPSTPSGSIVVCIHLCYFEEFLAQGAAGRALIPFHMAACAACGRGSATSLASAPATSLASAPAPAPAPAATTEETVAKGAPGFGGTLISQGAEAVRAQLSLGGGLEEKQVVEEEPKSHPCSISGSQRVFEIVFLGRDAIAKHRFQKTYRHPILDAQLTSQRVISVGDSLYSWDPSTLPPAMLLSPPHAGSSHNVSLQASWNTSSVFVLHGCAWRHAGDRANSWRVSKGGTPVLHTSRG
jgi:hypothetical protein